MAFLKTGDGGGGGGITFELKTYETSSLAGNTTSYIDLPLPNSYTEILAIIPVEINPATTWNTFGMFSYVGKTGRASFRRIGNDTQKYTIDYYVVYK